MLTPLFVIAAIALGAFDATWESLDSRENPKWFHDAKFGIFIHWGVYSVPSWSPKDRYAEWYWHAMQDKNGETWKFHVKTYGESFHYQDFAPMFKAELFDPDQWADIFVRSGAKYVVLTSKHHDGFCLWPSAEAYNWNAVDVGPHRDLLGDLTEAVRKRGLRMGYYYSLYEWFHPLYRTDVDRYVREHMLPQLRDLVTRYKPDILWGDGQWEHPSETWRTPEFLAWLFNEAGLPEIVINDRWGKETSNRHGGFATPEYGHAPKGRLMDLGRFEECQGMGRSFGYNRNEAAEDYRSSTELIHLLIDNVSRGGNLLLDIGPSADGRIPDIMQQRLLDIGAWLQVNGEAIYESDRWTDAPTIENVRFTRKGDAIYALCLRWQQTPLAVTFPAEVRSVTVSLLGYNGPVSARVDGTKVIIEPPVLTPDIVPCQHAWVYKIVTK